MSGDVDRGHGKREIAIRDEANGDAAGVRAVHQAAFDDDAEANIAHILREQARPLVSLVATLDETIVGHVVFSLASCSGHSEARIMALGPMAVAPVHQRRGIGSRLVVAGLASCRELGCGAIVVLGHPTYYPRFGFVPASRFELGCEYDVPPDVFMALELEPGALDPLFGVVRYHPAFRTA